MVELDRLKIRIRVVIKKSTKQSLTSPEQKRLNFTNKGQKIEFFDVKKEVHDITNPTVLKEILHGISGSFSPGELSSLMGPSGSGKTTLLNMLHPSRRGDHFSGTVLVDGVEMDKSFKRKVAYVLQEDIMHMGITVREQLTYTGTLNKHCQGFLFLLSSISFFL